MDHEFTLRLTQKYPHSIIRFNTILMHHSLGNIKKTFFYKHDFHSPQRLYYMVRNSYYIKDSFPEYSKKYKRIELLKMIFKENLISLKINHCYYMIKGFIHYKKNIKGKLQINEKI